MAPTALEGRKTLQEMHRALSEVGITVIAAGGINEDNAAAIVSETGVREIHGSCEQLFPLGTQSTVADVSQFEAQRTGPCCIAPWSARCSWAARRCVLKGWGVRRAN
jgi:copper homeostasis protein CutC